MITKMLLSFIRFYQTYISLDAGWLGVVGRKLGLRSSTPICIYQPTCSEYMYQAINRYGIIYGLWLGTKRIFRCHPWAKGGIDSVPTR